MEVNGSGAIGNVSSVRPATSPPSQEPATGNSQPIDTNDTVEISDAAKILGQVGESSSLHDARLEQIKEAILAGTYETPEKLEAALDKMLKEIEG